MVPMMKNIILTKLTMPRIQKKIVNRIELNEKLNGIINKRLTLVLAPAGYGKTSAICSWVSTKKFLSDFVWLSLSEDENEPAIFWTYFFAAVDKVYSNMYSTSSSRFKFSDYCCINDGITTFINQTADIDYEVFIFIDDFHHITNEEIHSQFKHMISYLGENIHVVLLSREFPGFFTPRMGMSLEFMLIQVEELKFSEKETTQFVVDHVDKELPMEELIKINKITDGWIALVTFIVEIANQDHEWMNSFQYENSVVFEYLEKEVFIHLPETVKNFMMTSSVFDTFDSQICDYLLNIKNSKEIMRDIENRRLFLYTTEKKEQGYKYNPILTEYLRQKFDAYYPELEEALFAKASLWYEGKRDIHHAISYSLKANHVWRTIDLLNNNLEDLIQDGFFHIVISTVDQLPEKSVEGQPLIILWYALARLLCGNFEDYETCLKLNGIRLDTQAFETYENEFRCIKAIYHHNKGEIEHSMNMIYKIDTEHLKVPMMNGVAEFFQGNNYRLLGYLDKAIDAFNICLEKSREFANIHLLIATINDLAYTNYLMGRLVQAYRLYKDGIHVIRSHGRIKTKVVNMLYFGLASISFEMNHIKESLDYLLMSLELSTLRDDKNFIMQGKLLHAKIMFTLGKKERCFELIKDAYALAINRRLRLIFSRRISDAVRMLIVLEKQTYINMLFDSFGIEIENEMNYQNESGHIAIADYLIDHGKNTRAIKLLEKLELEAKKSKRITSLIHILLLQALAAIKEDREEQALSKLKQALLLAYGKSFTNIFLFYGQPILEMFANKKLAEVFEDSKFLNLYCIKLLKDYSQQNQNIKTSKEHRSLKMLTNRENEVLKYFCMGLSNNEIKDKMCVSINTVKKHIQNIFQKLEVENRTQALNVAGLIKRSNA